MVDEILYRPLMVTKKWAFAWSLQWRHNGRDNVSNYQPHDCLFNRLFKRKSKKTLKLRVTGLCAGNSPVTGEFPAQMASNAENVSIWWRHHVLLLNKMLCELLISCKVNHLQATGLDAWASRVKCPARFVSHLHEICIYIYIYIYIYELFIASLSFVVCSLL